jgi:hypothetical protein
MEPMLELWDLVLDSERNDQLQDVIEGRRFSQVAEIGVSNPSWDIVKLWSSPRSNVFRRRYPRSRCFLDTGGEDMLYCAYQHTVQLKDMKQDPKTKIQTYRGIKGRGPLITRGGRRGLEQSFPKGVFGPYEFFLN